MLTLMLRVPKPQKQCNVPDSQLLLRRSREKYRQCLQISVLKATTQYRQWKVQIIVATSVYSALLVGMWKTCFQIQSRAFVLVCTTFFTLNSVRFVLCCALCSVHCAVSLSVCAVEKCKVAPWYNHCEAVCMWGGAPETGAAPWPWSPIPGYTNSPRAKIELLPFGGGQRLPHSFHPLFEIPNPNLSN